VDAVAGEDLSFEAWYRATHPLLLVAMRAYTGDRDVAAEVTDEAFSRALRHWRRVQTMASPDGWTYRVAVNLARRRARRQRVERRLFPLIASSPTVSPPAGEVWSLVRDLPPRQRLAVVLRYVADLDEAEVAAVMKVRRGTVASTLWSARQSLGALLAEPEAMEEKL